jgi:hypothetical protein
MARRYLKRPPGRIATIRHGMQLSFLLLNVWIGVLSLGPPRRDGGDQNSGSWNQVALWLSRLKAFKDADTPAA